MDVGEIPAIAYLLVVPAWMMRLALGRIEDHGHRVLPLLHVFLAAVESVETNQNVLFQVHYITQITVVDQFDFSGVAKKPTMCFLSKKPHT